MALEREKIIASLRKKGFEVHDDRDHIVLTFGGLTRSIYTKFSRGTKYKVYGNPLLGDVCRQLMLTRKQLIELVACPMGRQEYTEVLKAQGIGLQITPKIETQSAIHKKPAVRKPGK